MIVCQFSMSDDSQMSVTSVESGATSLLSALSTVAELKTNLNQLSELIHTESTIESPNVGDQSVSMQLDPTSERTYISEGTKVETNDNTETVAPLVQCDLKAMAHSILDVSTEVVRMLQCHRQRLSEVTDGLELNIADSELAIQETLENELQLMIRQYEKDSLDHENTASRLHNSSSVSPFDQTAVFEVLERHVKYSTDEMERAHTEFQLERARISSELNNLKEQVAFLEQKNEDLKAELSDANCQREAERQRDTKLIQQLREEIERTDEKWERQLELAQGQSNRLQHELDEIRQQGERECHMWRSKHTKLQAELQDLVDRYIPSQLFPWIADVPRRLSHFLNKVDKQCPWLPTALSKSDSAVIPNPESLFNEHDALKKQLTADRDHLQEQLSRVTADLSSMRLINAEQSERIEQLEKQARRDKGDLAKLKRNVLRYQAYLVQMLDPKNSANAIADIRHRICAGRVTQSVDDSSTPSEPTPSSRSSCSSVSIATPSSSLPDSNNRQKPTRSPSSQSSTVLGSDCLEGNNTTTPSNAQSPMPTKTSPSTTTSPSVLSRMTAAVSAFATAIISPRRSRGLPAREPVTVQMQDLSKSSKTGQTLLTSSEKEADDDQNVPIWPIRSRDLTTSEPDRVTPCTSASSSITNPHPTVAYSLPATGHQAGLKHKPVEETRTNVATANQSTPRYETAAFNPSNWSSFPWKHTDAASGVNKHLAVETDSTSSELRKTHSRSEQLSSVFAVPNAPAAIRAPALKRKPLCEIPVVDTGTELPVSTHASAPSSHPDWGPVPWKRVESGMEPKKDLEFEVGPFAVEGPLAESTAGPFKLPTAHPPSTLMHKRARVETGNAFLLEGPLAESTSGPFRPPSLNPNSNNASATNNNRRPRPDVVANPTVSSKPKRVNPVDAPECTPS